MPSAPTAERRFSSLAKTYGPWLVAGLAIIWLFRVVQWHELVAAFRAVPLGRYLFASAVLLVLNCAADAVAMYYTFGWFGCRVPYRELFVVRAATYLLAVVQYYVGQAAILAFLHQRKGVPFMRATGWILFISGINMGVLVLLAAVGLAGGDARVPWLWMVPVGVGLAALGYAALLVWRPSRLAQITVFAPLFEMGIRGHIKATLVRLPHVLVLIVWHFLSLRWFGIQVPLFQALCLLPAVFFATALPISIQGLGLSQMAAVYFFVDYAPAGKAAVLAYSLAMTSVSLITQVAMGLGFLPAARRLGVSEGEMAALPTTAIEVRNG
jgi:hypothetical protein